MRNTERPTDIDALTHTTTPKDTEAQAPIDTHTHTETGREKREQRVSENRGTYTRY